jgi:hypothetical protein
VSDIWENMIEAKSRIETLLSDFSSETFEPGMEKFNFEGWENRTWTSSVFRRAHIETIDVRNDKKLWIMHCCIFPHLDDSSPIFGIDVIAGKKKLPVTFLIFRLP